MNESSLSIYSLTTTNFKFFASQGYSAKDTEQSEKREEDDRILNVSRHEITKSLLNRKMLFVNLRLSEKMDNKIKLNTNLIDIYFPLRK